jgi:alpha-tubulin suppressor-like RCC1 family protein
MDCVSNLASLVRHSLIATLAIGGLAACTESSAPPTAADPPAAYIVGTVGSPVAGSNLIISAQLVDAGQSAISEAGRVVTWSELGAGGSFSSPTSVTGSNGVATVTFTLTTVSGTTYTFSAMDANRIGGSSPPIKVLALVTNYVVTPSVIDPPAGAQISILAQEADAFGNNADIPGRVVTWNKVGTGGVFSSATSVTGAAGDAGIAAVDFATSATPGTTYTISATDPTGAAGTSVSITTQPQVSLSSLAAGLGWTSTCALSASGKAYCWGSNPLGQSRPLLGAVNNNFSFSSLSGGRIHICGLTATGVAYCWGDNTQGEIGDNSNANRSVPTAVAGGLVFTAIGAGDGYTCGLVSSGSAYCWGDNTSSQLGNNAAGTTSRMPVPVAGGFKFVAIGAGAAHTCALTQSGAAYCWGSNQYGQLGDNSTTVRATPTLVSGGLTFASLTVGADHTCGVVASGGTYCWGDNSTGELGTSSTAPFLGVPTRVSGPQSFVSIAAGGFHTCGITAAGTAYCWGDNSEGELGDGTFVGRPVPTLVSGGLQFKSVSAGGIRYDDPYYGPAYQAHTCAITTAGIAYCWGSNENGELGWGSSAAFSATPVRVGGQP